MIPYRAKYIAGYLGRRFHCKCDNRKFITARPQITKYLIPDTRYARPESHFGDRMTADKRAFGNRHIQNKFGIVTSAYPHNIAVFYFQSHTIFKIVKLDPFCIQRLPLDL